MFGCFGSIDILIYIYIYVHMLAQTIPVELFCFHVPRFRNKSLCSKFKGEIGGSCQQRCGDHVSMIERTVPTTAAKLRDDHVSGWKGQCPQQQQSSEMIMFHG